MSPNPTNQKSENEDEATQGQQDFSDEPFNPSLPTNIQNMTAEEVRRFEEVYKEYVDRQEGLSTSRIFATSPPPLLASPPDISRARLLERNTSTEQDYAIFHPSYTNLGSPPDAQNHPHPSPAMHFQSPIHHQQQQPQSSRQQEVPVAPINTHHLSPPFRLTIPQQQSHSSSNYRFSPRRPQTSQPSTANSSFQRNSQKCHSRKEEKNKPGRPREHHPAQKDINNAIKNDKCNRYQSLPPKERTRKAKERLANNYAVNRSRQKKFVTGQEVLDIISGLMERDTLAYQKFVAWKKKKNGKNIIETLRDLLPKEPNTSKGKGRSKKSLAEAEEAEDEETEDEEECEEICEEGTDSHDDNDYQPPPPPPPSLTMYSY